MQAPSKLSPQQRDALESAGAAEMTLWKLAMAGGNDQTVDIQTLLTFGEHGEPRPTL